jgi:hypothetical protein
MTLNRFILLSFSLLLVSCSKSSEFEHTRYLHSCVENKCEYRKKWVIGVDTAKQIVVIKVFLRDGNAETIYFSKKCMFQNENNWDCIMNMQSYVDEFVMIDGNFKYKEYITFSDGSQPRFLDYIASNQNQK